MFLFFLDLPTCLSSPVPYNICLNLSLFFDLLSENQVAFVLVPFGCCNKNTINWVAYKQQTFISHSSGGWESKVTVPADATSGESPPSSSEMVLLPVSSQGGRGRGSFIRTLIPFMRASPSWPKQFPKTPSPNTITLGMRFQHMNFGGT